jgi:peptidyl-prolyl cis-trans isomerase C
MLHTTPLAALMFLAFSPAAFADAVTAPAAPAAPAATADTANPAAAAAKPVAIVNGKEIPALYGELVKREMMATGQPDSPQLDQRVRDSLVSLELLSRAAIDKGLDRDPRLAAALDIRRKDMLAKAYLEDYVRSHPVSEAEIQAEYDKARAAANTTEYHARHILVKTEDEAKKVLAELNKKAKFEELAKKYSKDPGSAKNGGDLGWTDPAAFVKEFATGLTSLKKGEITKTPVKTQFGYHIIQLVDTRPMAIPPLAEVRGEIVKQLQQRRAREAIAAVREGAKIE